MSRFRQAVPPEVTTAPAPRLGDVKAAIRQFAAAQADNRKEQLEAELRSAYRCLCEQVAQAGVDPERAMSVARSQATKFQLAPAISQTVQPRARSLARGTRR
jgi:hypothetical protein